VTSTRVEDGAGNVNEVKLTDVRRNSGIKDSAFDVNLPKDVRLIDSPGR
jgi:outer membrane lipoprotein-sorting protein